MKYRSIYAWCRNVDTEQLVDAINEYCDEQGTTDHILTDVWGDYYSMRGKTPIRMSISDIRCYYYNAVCDGDDETFRENIKEMMY